MAGMELFEKVGLSVIIGVFVAVVAFFGYAIYDGVTAETYSLRKDSWHCTESHEETTYISQQIGKTTITTPSTSTVCTQWSKNRG